MKTRWLSLPVLPLILACTLVRPASAGEVERTVTLFSDGRGDSAWVEVDRTAGRTQATPYLRVSGETVQRAVETSERAGEVRVSVAPSPRAPERIATPDRKARRKEALASLLEGPDGISLGGLLDIARDASEAAGDAVRQFKTGMTASPRTEPPR